MVVKSRASLVTRVVDIILGANHVSRGRTFCEGGNELKRKRCTELDGASHNVLSVGES